MTPEKASEIISASLATCGRSDVVEIGFFGGSFTGIPIAQQEALLQLACDAKEQGYVQGVRLSTRPDYINDEILARLKKFGVTTIELGAQSMNDAVLDACNRGHKAASTIKAAQKIKEAGFELGLQMMLGLPGDTFESACKTAEVFIALKADCVRIYPTLVLTGTKLQEQYENGNYVPLCVDEAVEQCAVLYDMFCMHNIDVIRMGLLDMDKESICAGPYHPAFGERVMSRVCYNRMATQMAQCQGKSVVVRVNPRYISILVGQKRENLRKLKEQFSLTDIILQQDETIPFGTFKVLQGK